MMGTRVVDAVRSETSAEVQGHDAWTLEVFWSHFRNGGGAGVHRNRGKVPHHAKLVEVARGELANHAPVAVPGMYYSLQPRLVTILLGKSVL